MHGSRRRMAESEFITHNKRKKKKIFVAKVEAKKQQFILIYFCFHNIVVS